MEPEQPTEGPPSINIPEGAQIQDVHVHYNATPPQHLLQNQELILQSQQQLQRTQDQNQQQLLQILQQPQQNPLQADQSQQLVQFQQQLQRTLEQNQQQLLQIIQQPQNLQQSQQNPLQADQLQQMLQTQEQTPQQIQHVSRVNIQPLAKELQEKLSNNAKEVVEQFVLPIDIERTINRVNLQICKVKQHADVYWENEASSLEWRMCMERKHVQTVYGTKDQRISINEIFDTAKEIATDEAERKFKDENSKKLYIKKHGNTVCLTGLPGIGKTTLTQMVTQTILAELLLPDTQYLFYILIRNVNFERKVSVSQFLIENSLLGQAYSNEEYRAITQELQNNPNVVIVMDGLDEAGVSFSTTTHCCQLDTKEKPVDIIKNLFNATLLPNAVKLVTSRPGRFYHIHQDYRPSIVLEVLGLDKAAQEELIKQLCGVEKYPGTAKLLEQKANLSAMCYVPVNCIYIIDSILSGVGDINSMTQVLISTLTKYISSGHLKNMDEAELRIELIKLTELAFRGFEKKKVVFDINDFEEVDLPDPVVANFLHTYVEQSSRIKMKILDGKKRSYFAHLTLQEFFCAIYVMFFMPYESLAEKRSMFKDVHWDVVVRFMFGLCNSSAYEDMRDIFPASRIRDFEKKKQMLLEIVSCQNLYDNDTLIKVSGWVNESNDKKISTTFDKRLSSDVELKLPNDPSKAHDVAFALKSGIASHNVNVAFTTEALSFFRGLQHSTNLKIKQLTLVEVDMTNLTEYLVRHMNDINELKLFHCKHVSAAMKELGPAINQRSNKIDLCINADLDDDGAKALGDCLRNISELQIEESSISVQSRILLREAVQQLPNHQDLVVDDDGGWGEQDCDQWVKTWTVYGCDEADDLKRILQLEPGKIRRLSLQALDTTLQPRWYDELEMREIVGYLQPHMEALDELRLDDCEQLIAGLSQAINARQNKMVLDMGLSDLDEDVAKALGDCLRNISELGIDERRISVQSRIILREAVQQLPNPQDLVVDDAGYGGLDKQNGAQWVKTWTVYGCDEADDVKRILQLEPGKITRLSLQARDITSQAPWYKESERSNIVGYLQPHMEALDELRLDECGELIIGLSQAINERLNKMKLEFIWNRLNKDEQLPDEVVQYLSSCLGKISELDLRDYKLSPNSRLIMHNAIKQIPSPQDLVVVDDDGWRKQNGAQWVKTWTLHRNNKADDLKRILQLEPGKITRLSLQALDTTSQGTWYEELEMRDIVGYLHPHMEALDELQLDGCGQLIVGLSQAINERQNKMVLDIRQSDLDEDGAKVLGDCLRKISILLIDERFISVQSRIILRETVQQLPNPQDLVVYDVGGWREQNGDQWVKTWTLYRTDKPDDVKRILQLEPGKITRLLLQAWEYPSQAPWYKESERSNIVGYLQPHMEALDELRLDGCGELIGGLSQAINERQNKMKLGLFRDIFNKNKQLPDEVVQCLSRCLGKISELELGDNILSPNSHLIMQDAIKKLPSPQGFTLKGEYISDLMY